MRYLLDTVAFVRAVSAPDRLSRKARTAIERADSELELSTVSVSEIAIKSGLGKLTFTEADILRGLADLEAHTLSWTFDHARELFRLPLHHADPFDRQIIAQAAAEKLTVITSDESFLLYAGIRVLW